VLQGELGMGKTHALDDVRAEAQARDFEVLETRGIEADAEPGFGALLTLLRPVDGDLDALAGSHAADLRAALTLGTRRPTDDAQVRLALYAVVTTLAERRPLALLVDDAHDLDAATAGALAFVVGRLGRDSVATVLTSDRDLPAPLGDLAIPAMAVPRLPPAELEALVTAAVGPLAPDALQQCCALADGNPLIALELARALTHDERDGTAPLSDLPRPPELLARRYALRFDGFDEVAGRALAVAAADETHRAAVVRAALAELGEPADALERAEQTGVLEVDGPTLRFTHPLLRAVAYHRLAPGSRRAAHRALAVSLRDPEDAVARAWQLAAAADGEDADAAEALALVASDLVRRGAGPSAARVYERAAALTPTRRDRVDRTLRAAEAWLDGFVPDAAARVVADLPAGTDADTLLTVATALRWSAGPVAALERVRAVTDDATASLARAVEADLLLDARGDEAARSTADGVLAEADDDLACALAATVLARVGGATAAPATSVTSGRAGALLLRRAALAEAEIGVAPTLLPSGVEAVLAQALADRHAGRLHAAYDQLNLELGLVPGRAAQVRTVLELALADVEQLLGRADDARTRAEAVAAGLDAKHARGLASSAHWVLGRLHLASGDVAQGCAVLETAAQTRPLLHGPELAVALCAQGRSAAAERVIGDVADATGPVASARVARVRAVLRGDDQFARRAAESARDAGLRVEAAETLIACAELLARAGRRDDARAAAADATDLLDGMGARGWDARLARVTDAAPGADAGIAAELTSAEYRVALAVSNGATNREAAAELFVSVKTVDFHLQNIYRKLGLRSRTELAVLVRGDGGRGR
jgi:DNA-binding NarL/FixJ family response regulator